MADSGCQVTVVPAEATAADVLRHRPDGIFLSNGPGDPAATGAYAVPVLQELIGSGIPIFGICLGHQLLGLALGGRTRQDGDRPSRRQSSGQGPGDRQGRDHQPESRLHRDARQPAGRGREKPMCRCSTARSRASRSRASRSSRCSTTPKPRPGRATATICSTASST
ncbi:MAG: gamma-glutamyl-gamma-aminobutyrate hydrolase family protein [Pseudomonadota bacterium]